MKVSGAWIDNPATQALCLVLTGAGHQALFVGGCVRNAALGLPVGDIDIATDALPEKVTNLAEDAGFKVVPTGIEHGTVTVLSGGIPHEVTTFRRDVATNGRHAVVAFTDQIAEDAARRDFTMNALYATPDGAVLDPLDGLADLQARRLRFVGLAEDRIREDYLRILRFFRFTAIYGDPGLGMDAEGLAACAGLSAGIETLSAERIGMEMRKLMLARDPAPVVAAMAQVGILRFVLPGGDPRALAPLVHLEADDPPRWLRRLAVLGGEDVTERWRLSRAESRDLARLRTALGATDGPAVLGWKLGADLAADAMLARAASLGVPPDTGWQHEVARGAEAVFPVKAADLPGLSGPALGARLKALEQRWLAEGLWPSREDLIG